jgi:transposase InsO family protein
MAYCRADGRRGTVSGLGFWKLFDRLWVDAGRGTTSTCTACIVRCGKCGGVCRCRVVVVCILNELVAFPRHPSAARVDNGPEIHRSPFIDWCAKHGVAKHYIHEGTREQNAYIEHFIGAIALRC